MKGEKQIKTNAFVTNKNSNAYLRIITRQNLGHPADISIKDDKV